MATNKRDVINWGQLKVDLARQKEIVGAEVLSAAMGCSPQTLYRFLSACDSKLLFEHFIKAAHAVGKKGDDYLLGRQRKVWLGLTGYGRSGKDSLAQSLVERYGFFRIGFADYVRNAALAIDPHVVTRFHGVIRLSRLVSEAGWEKAKEEDDVRRLLQNLGTDFGREMVSPDIWVDMAKKAAEPHDRVVFTDVRFANEVAICTHTCRVVRPGYGPVNDHKSEALPDDGSFVLHNEGDLADLAEAAEVLWQSL